MLDVLVTMRFDDRQLARLRAVSPEIRVRQATPEAADYRAVDVLYAGAPPRDLGRAPALQWVQLHMAGIDALAHDLSHLTDLSDGPPDQIAESVLNLFSTRQGHADIGGAIEPAADEDGVLIADPTTVERAELT